MRFDVEHSGKDLAQISRQLRSTANGKVLRREMSKNLRIAAAPLVPAVRASIGKIPVTGGDTSGLRARLQKATRLSVITAGKNASVSVLVDPKRMPSGQKALPAYMEGTKNKWRHPVFGNEDNWVAQKAHPYFYKVVRPAGATAKLAVNQAIKTVTKKIT